MPRIVVVGGHGFLGSRAVRALRRDPTIEVIVAGRTARAPGDRVVDLSRAETFAALDGADVVVNASSSHAAPPDALARHCLERGLVMLEASSDRVVIERLLDAHRGRGDGTGALVLGAGIFTGVSNAMAGEVARALPGADAIEIAVRSSPFSGAGDGTVDLMADALAVPTRTIERGARALRPAVARGPVMPFPGGPARTLHVSFAEPVMVHASTGVPEIAMYMAPRPPALRLAFLALPAWLVAMRAFGALIRIYFRVLRRVLLRGVTSRVDLVARARRGAETSTIAISVDDGMEAGGTAIAATAIALARRAERPRGTFVVDELVPLDAMLDAMRALDPAATISRSDRGSTP